MKISLSTKQSAMDPLLCEYLEHLWSSGAGRAQACDTLAGLQDIQPNLRNRIPGAWRLLKTRAQNELPCRAPPLPEHVVSAMVGWAFFKGHNSFALSLLIGFYCMLRTGEVLGLYNRHILCAPRDAQALTSLGLTKGGKRQGASESVILGVEPVLKVLKQWKTIAQPSTPLVASGPKWRALFVECLIALRLDQYQFRPYSLRRGGATFWFSRHHSLDRILLQGRWQTQKSARIYLNEGLAVLATMTIPVTDKRLKVYHSTLQHLTFKTLDPPALKGGSAGGRGRKAKKPNSGNKKHSKGLL